MRIEFDIRTADDARQAADVCTALATFLGGTPSAEPTLPEPATAVAPALADVEPPPAMEIPDDIEAARKLLQEVARGRGVTWLRQQTATYGVKRLADLSEDAARALLRKAVARD